MRFISKSSNLLVVLRPGLSAQPLTGTPAKPTISVRFKDGVADVPDGELVDMMLSHSGFSSDFIAADSGDPYRMSRTDVEPQHVVTEMQFGTPVKRHMEGGKRVVLSPEMQAIVKDMAIALAKEMLPSMVEGTLKSIVDSHKSDKQQEVTIEVPKKQRGRPGRKPSVKNVTNDSEAALSATALQDTQSVE